MERPSFLAVCLFTMVVLLQGNGTWQASSDGLTRTQRGERVAPGYCPDGWYTFGEMCYLTGTSKMSWESSVTECSRMNSYLVSIHSQQEQEFLDMLVSEIRSETWIGLRRSTVRTNEFEWRDFSPLDYTNWGEGEPNNYESMENCANIEYSRFNLGQWNDASCSARHSYICKKPKDPTLTKPGQDPSMCPWKSGWLKMSDTCYRIFHKTESFSSWSQAQSLCKGSGGNLAYVKNPALNQLLKINAEGLEGPFWTGIKSTNKHKYTWLGKNHALFYSNWQTDEPKDIPDEQNCVAMDPEGKWIVRDCDERHPFVCQIGPEIPEAPTIGPHDENMTCSYTSQKWHDIGGKYCYIVELVAKFKWREALCRCQEEGGSLASLHSSEETNVLLHYIKHHDMPHQPVLIGLVRDERGIFGWSDGSAYDYVNWNNGEPNRLDEQCATMYITSGKWNDVNCHYVFGYVCSTLKVPQRGKSTSTTKKLVSKRKTDKLTGEEAQVSEGSIVMISVTCLLVVAAVAVVSLYCFGNSLRMKLLERSPYSGIN